VTAEYLPRIQGGWEDAGAVKVACDVKSALLALGPAGHRGARIRSRLSCCTAFLLDAEPPAAHWRSRRGGGSMCNWGPRPKQHADITLELWKQLAPAVEARGMAKPLPRNRAAAGAGAGAHGGGTGVRIDTGELRRLAEADGRPDRAADGPDSWDGRADVQHRLARSSLARCCSTSCSFRRPVNTERGRRAPPPRTCWKPLAAENEIVRLVLEYRQLYQAEGT